MVNNSQKDMNNILFSCSGRKIHTINWIKNSILNCGIDSKLFLADKNEKVISKFFGDHFWKSPDLNDKNFKKILKYLLKHKIKIIFPSSDNELVFWSKYKKNLSDKKIYVMVSSPETIKVCLDKYKFYKFLLKNKIPTIETSTNIKNINSKKFVVKNRFSEDPHCNFINLDKKNSILNSRKIKRPIFQKFISGKEVSVDCYINKNGKSTILMRYRKSIFQGESEHTVVFKNKKIYSIILRFIKKFKFYGHIIIQGIQFKDKFLILECNPRVGGASAICYFKKLDSFSFFLKENIFSISKKEIRNKIIKSNNFIIHKMVRSID